MIHTTHERRSVPDTCVEPPTWLAGAAVVLDFAAVLDGYAREAFGDDRGPHAACDSAEVRERLLRCLTGNPRRVARPDPCWQTPTVIALAATIRAGRAFERMPSLAAALVVAGCDDRELLGHCRDHGPHVRGCWALAVLLNGCNEGFG